MMMKIFDNIVNGSLAFKLIFFTVLSALLFSIVIYFFFDESDRFYDYIKISIAVTLIGNIVLSIYSFYK